MKKTYTKWFILGVNEKEMNVKNMTPIYMGDRVKIREMWDCLYSGIEDGKNARITINDTTYLILAVGCKSFFNPALYPKREKASALIEL